MLSQLVPQNASVKELTIAMDLEWYDQSHPKHGGYKVQELGISLMINFYPPPSTTTPLETAPELKTVREFLHYRVREHMHLINRYCKTSPLGFVFGTSTVLPQSEISSRLQELVSSPCDNLCLVGHGCKEDLVILRGVFGIDFPEHTRFEDTAKFYQQVEGSKQTKKLEYIMDDLNIPYKRQELHNAGNDAAYTLQVWEKIMNMQFKPPLPLTEEEIQLKAAKAKAKKAKKEKKDMTKARMQPY